MRYFQYKNTNKTQNNALKAQYKALTEQEKRTFRKEKCWKKASLVATLIIYFSCIIVGIWLLVCIPEPNQWGWAILLITGEVAAGFVLLFLSAWGTMALTMPLWKKAESFHVPSIKKDIFSKACRHLREYYQLQAPYVITKCFDATEQKFQKHDVCIFVVGDELRITADLVHGFLHGERDLGCYAFKRDEISLSKRQDKHHLIAELKADNTVFLLGYRAKGFIEKHFTAIQTEAI